MNRRWQLMQRSLNDFDRAAFRTRLERDITERKLERAGVADLIKKAAGRWATALNSRIFTVHALRWLGRVKLNKALDTIEIVVCSTHRRLIRLSKTFPEIPELTTADRDQIRDACATIVDRVIADGDFDDRWFAEINESITLFFDIAGVVDDPDKLDNIDDAIDAALDSCFHSWVPPEADTAQQAKDEIDARLVRTLFAKQYGTDEG